MPAAGASRARLAEMMVGRDVTAPHELSPRIPGEVRLALRNITVPGLSGLSFEIRGGEILGVAGVDGNGQIELAEALTGLRRATNRSMLLGAVDVPHARVAARVRAGMAYMPADRSSTALVRNMSVAENLMLRDSDRSPYGRGALLARQPLVAKAREVMMEYDIRASGPGALVARLSGGNQQQICVTGH